MFAFVSITVWYTKVNYSYDIKVKLPVHYFVFTLVRIRLASNTSIAFVLCYSRRHDSGNHQ